MYGLTRADLDADDDVIWIFPENWAVLGLFSDMATQWYPGFNGPTGLNYAVLPVVFDLHEIANDKRRAHFNDLRIMERAALEIMSKLSK